MDLQLAMFYARNYVIFGDPNGDLGSFEPLSGSFQLEAKLWEIVCYYKRRGEQRKAKILISDSTSSVMGFQIIEES